MLWMLLPATQDPLSVPTGAHPHHHMHSPYSPDRVYKGICCVEMVGMLLTVFIKMVIL